MFCMDSLVKVLGKVIIAWEWGRRRQGNGHLWPRLKTVLEPVRFQTLDKWQRCQLNISKQRFPGSPSIPLVLPCYRALLTGMPHPLPWILQPIPLGCLPPAAFPYIIQPFWLLSLFLYLWSSPAAAPLSLPFSPLSLPFPPLLQWLRVMSTLDSPRCPCLLPYVNNKPSPPSCLGAGMFFPFFLFSEPTWTGRRGELTPASYPLRNLLHSVALEPPNP